MFVKRKMINMIENFDKLEFNRKVDVLVAMHVFNQKVTIINTGSHWLCTWLPEVGTAQLVTCYSTLVTSAWDIVRKFDCFELKHYSKGEGLWNGKWRCIINGCLMGSMIVETEQLAICYAGLKAVGFDVKSFLKEEGKI